MRRGFSLIETLVVIGVLAALAALLLPAVQGAREAGRRTQCQNNLRQLGLALHEYHNAHSEFPIGCIEWRPWGATAERQLAWSAWLLPYLGQSALYDQIDFTQAFDAPRNVPAASAEVAVFRCPSSLRTVDETTRFGALGERFGVSDYGGLFGERIVGRNSPPTGVMLHDAAVSLVEVLDGASYTLAVGEDARHEDGQWMNGRNLFDQAFAINGAPDFENDLRSEHPQGCQGLGADGAVHFLAESIDLRALAALCTRANGEASPTW